MNRVLPVALPVPEETAPQASRSAPGAPAAAAAPTAPAAPARPLVGPVVPLNATATESEELLGGAAQPQYYPRPTPSPWRYPPPSAWGGGGGGGGFFGLFRN